MRRGESHMQELITVSQDEGIATITLNRADVHNAISVDMYRQLPEAVAPLEDDPEVKVVVLRGAGEKSFSAGADIKEFERERSSAELAHRYNQHVAAAEHALDQLSKPLIAMIHGYCVGGGAGLALSCDIRFADEKANFAITPAKLGLVYSLESTKRVVDLAGPSRAKWILMSGLPIHAERALQLGLFDELLQPEELESFTYDFARTVTSRAQFSVRTSKEMVRRVVAGQVEDNEATIALRNESFSTEDYAEGVRAFLTKRKPEFRWS